MLIPLYNEEETIAVVLDRVLRAELPPGIAKELIVVDDGSSDGSGAAVEEFCAARSANIRLIYHKQNMGKGAAIRTALDHASGDFAIIQDADLEYDPSEYSRLLGPLLEGKADVVYGSRFMVSGERRVLYYWHSIANHVLTTACNMVADVNLTDMETCYKVFRVSLVKSIPLRSNRFGIEPELTIKLAQRNAAIYEMPINYHGRTYREGKKIGFKDAVQALFIILRYGFTRDIYLDSGAQILDTLAKTPNFNEWMASNVRPHLGPSVLELGAGIGNLTVCLAKGRKRYTATDISGEHLNRLQTRFGRRPTISVHRCDLESSRDFEALGQAYSSVVCLNVLEHVGRDVEGLRNIYSVLEPGGRAVILVPNDPAIYGTLDRVLEHHRRYTPAELRQKLETVGFEVEQIAEFNRVTRPGWILNGLWLKREAFGRFQLWVFDHLVWFWKRIDRFLPWKPVSIVAIGKRPL